MADYYFAYGSNLNLLQFGRRCPEARRLGRLTLPDFQLVFRGVADIIDAPGEAVEGAIYQITPRCEEALDLYEGFPNLYYKRNFVVEMGKSGKVADVMFYVMNRELISPPDPGYLATIKRGYHDWNIPTDSLNKAVQHSYDTYAKAVQQRARKGRHGRKGSKLCGDRDDLSGFAAYR